MPREKPWTTNYHSSSGSKLFGRLPKRSRKKTILQKGKTKISFNRQAQPMVVLEIDGKPTRFVLRQYDISAVGGKKFVLKVATGLGNAFSGLRLASKAELKQLLRCKKELKKAGWDFSRIIIPKGKIE